jgi:hypothetical protein
MPDLKEVFDMTTKEVEPDLDAWREQQQRQRAASRRKRMGAFAVAAAIAAVAVLAVVSGGNEPKTRTLISQPTRIVSPPFIPIDYPIDPYILDLRTGVATALPDVISDGGIYDVSPDGTQVAYSWCCAPPNPVIVADMDVLNVRQINPEGVDGFGGAWSPDGSKIVYQQRDAATKKIGNLVVVDLASGEQTQITDLEPATYGAWFLAPTFSADGSRVLFHHPRGPDGDHTQWDIWSVPVGGGEARLEIRDAAGGAFSPDGSAIAYVDSPRGWWSSERIVIADLATGGRRLVPGVGGKLQFPVWSPSGSKVAFFRGDEGAVWIYDVEKGETVALETDEGKPVEGWPAWVDEDRLLLRP